MTSMEVKVISTETIKPSPTTKTETLKLHKLCLFDQLTPMTYIIGVLFYPNTNPSLNNATETLTRLKNSLSETLDIYYPFSGRNDGENLHVSSFDAGIPFVEARVNLPMSEYLNSLGNNVDSLNHLVPFAPFWREKAKEPLLAVQASVFSCRGIALGASLCHKNADGTTSCFFNQSWAAICRGSPRDEVVIPNLDGSSTLFPPMSRGVPEKYLSLMDRLWFNEGRYVTRRFVFSGDSVEALRERSRSITVPKPSRNDAVSCFIWKHATMASWGLAKPGSPRRTSIAGPAVNIRPRMKSPAVENSIGNLFWWGMAVLNPNDNDRDNDNDLELSELVVRMNEAMEGFERDFLKGVKEGREGSPEIIGQLELMLSIEPEDPYIIGFTNWRGFFNEVDFGFGRPCWVGGMGKVGPAFRNLVILVESQLGDQGIEAFIALESKEMGVLESDSKFLAFASHNPAFSCM